MANVFLPRELLLGTLLCAATVLLCGSAAAQRGPQSEAAEQAQWPGALAPGLHLVVSLKERTLWLNDGEKLLYTAPVGVARDRVLVFEGRTWTFRTPRGRRTVVAKERDPVWIPPDWHYAELATLLRFDVVWLERTTPVPLSDGSRVVVYKNRVGRLTSENVFEAVPPGGEAVFENTLFVPPLGTENRKIAGVLGRYKLDIGDGYYLHGTPDERSVGEAESHGCLRLAAADLEYLFQHVPVGTAVFIY